jgi:DNA-3-methyladenine glycosylase
VGRDSGLYAGPGKLTKQLNINKSFNGQMANKKTGLYLADGGIKIAKSQIKVGPRVGVAYAGPVWSKKKWRFWLDDKVEL